MRIMFVVLLIGLMLPAQAQRPGYPPDIPDARTEVYRSVGDVQLKAWIVEPPARSAEDPRPAIVFFFGGGWNGGTPGQFKIHAAYLAERGIVAILADYRVRSRQGTLANVAVSDAQTAVRWVRTNAERLGVDPSRIGAGGGSAGGHLAAATAMLPWHGEPGTAAQSSWAPDALVLFNPVLITAPVPGLAEAELEKVENMRSRLGAEPISMSPFHNVRSGLPPTIIFHGHADQTVPYHHAELFAAAMAAAGNHCELVGYPDQGHGFFNAHRMDNAAYRDTIERLDAFLVELGWLAPP